MITPQESEVLAHTSRTGRYVTDEAHIIDMGVRGLLFDHGAQEIAGGMHDFVMTPAGREALNEYRAAQPRPAEKHGPWKPLTRSQERYRRYRRCAECFDNFLQFCRYDAQRQREARTP